MESDLNNYISKTIDFHNKNNLSFNSNKLIPYNETKDSIFCISYDYFQNEIANIELLTGKECNIDLIEKDEFLNISNIIKEKNNNNFELIEIDTDDSVNIKVINYLNDLIEEAIINRVSDIHIEPLSNNIRIRFRIDGKLVFKDELEKDSIYNIIITRIKILTKLDISERRRPQDGRITFNYNNREIDLRVSIIPTITGEKIVLRILDSDLNELSLSSLGIKDDDLNYLIDESKKSSGMVLVVGPTGSGKTTTLYALLKEIYTDEINVTTIEDPVEYKIDDFNQIQVNYKQGLDFSSTLKNILRQDPDILIIGELRDIETVETAIRASITGHFVASTIHTQDAISTIFRLKDMGSKPYLVSQSLKTIISQRLVRKLCPYCKELSDDSFEDIKPLKHYKAVGCERCNNGYKGREGAFEILKIDRKIKELIVSNAGYDEILSYALDNGFTPLKSTLKEYVKDGTTSLEEIFMYI